MSVARGEGPGRQGADVRPIDVSVVISPHRIGRVAHHTMRSVLRAIDYANERSVATEIVISMDRPDEPTRRYFRRYEGPGVTIEEVDFGDLGLNRNNGVRLASGTYVALLDDDNLFCRNWLHTAFSYLEAVGADVVAHPEYQVFFEAQRFVLRQISSRDPSFRVAGLLEQNYWDAVCMTKRDLLLRLPYESTTRTPGFGYEDWHWNCKTLAAGIEHHVVPGTVHFMRRKRANSLLSMSNLGKRTIRPTELFEPARLAAMMAGERARGAASGRPGDTCSPEPAAARALGIAAAALRRRLRLAAASVIERLYRVAKSIMLPLLAAHPNLARFAVAAGESVTGLKSRPAFTWPAWLAAECKAIHQIEPRIFPDGDTPLLGLSGYMPLTPFADYYLRLRALCGDDVSHVLLVSWLNKGGADLVVTNYVRALIEGEAAKRVVVIATLNADSPWAEKLHPEARFIEFGREYAHLQPDVQERLLARLLLQMAPRAVHVVNSESGYRVFTRFGGALSTLSHLYATVFCADITCEGKSVGYAYDYLPDCIDHLEAVSVDTSNFAEKLCDLFAFDPNKIHVHYQPASLEIAPRRAPLKAGGTFNILWAGRLDRQKRPDILAGIAAGCLGDPFHFHVYGESVLDAAVSLKSLKDLKNVTLYGAFDGVGALPLERFDLFLYTSQWDGLPTILLDIMAAGLPIVASAVGGVGELIVPDKTGFLVDPFDDTAQYVRRIREGHRDPAAADGLARNGAALLAQRHTMAKFIERVRSFPGYACPAADSNRRAASPDAASPAGVPPS